MSAFCLESERSFWFANSLTDSLCREYYKVLLCPDALYKSLNTIDIIALH